MASDLPDSPKLLESLVTRTLRVTTKDTRMFVGELKCTDRDMNLILSKTHEYRIPKFSQEQLGRKVDLKSRFLGLVVVMGTDVVKVEVDERVATAVAAAAASRDGSDGDVTNMEH